MRRTVEERRLRAIKSKFMILGRICECCKEEVSFEKMWVVDRWGAKKMIYPHYYCQKCMHTVKDVLNEIDNDACPYGIAFVDPYMKTKNKERRLQMLQEIEQKKQKKKKSKKKG